MSDVKYPQVNVAMVGEDSDAFAILGRVGKALKQAGIDKEVIEVFMKEATSSDYNHLLATVMKWVNMEKRVYGKWSGNPNGRAEDITRCIEAVTDDTGWHRYQCSRKRGHGIDRLYCKQHAKKHVLTPIDFDIPSGFNSKKFVE